MKLDYTTEEVYKMWAETHAHGDDFIKAQVASFIRTVKPEIIIIIHNTDDNLKRLLKNEFLTEFCHKRCCVRLLHHHDKAIAIIFLHNTEPHYSEYIFLKGNWVECSKASL